MNRLFIGLDGGGTRTRLLAEDDTGRRWTAEGDAANPRIVGIERASDVIASLIRSAAGEFGNPSSVYVCGGIAGTAAGSMQRAMTDSVKLDLDHDDRVDISLTDDATIAYEAAFHGSPGILFVLGTGSTVLVRTRQGSFIRWGGWGYLLGDEGSGYSIGRAGLRAVAASIDANEPTVLTTRAASDLAVSTREQLLEKVYGSDYSLAAFAPAILEEAGKGDAQAANIVDSEIRKLIDRVKMLVSRPELDIPGTVKVTGGLSASRPYMMTLAEIMAEHFPEWKITKSGSDPVEGALWMAKNWGSGSWQVASGK